MGGLKEELRLLSGFEYKEVLMRFGATNWMCSTGGGPSSLLGISLVCLLDFQLISYR